MSLLRKIWRNEPIKDIDFVEPAHSQQGAFVPISRCSHDTYRMIKCRGRDGSGTKQQQTLYPPSHVDLFSRHHRRMFHRAKCLSEMEFNGLTRYQENRVSIVLKAIKAHSLLELSISLD
jgi:hypothetical protein